MRTIRELAGWGLLLVVQVTPFAALAMLAVFLDDTPSPGLLVGALLAMLLWPRLWLSSRRLREPPEDEVAEADGRRPVVLLHRFARASEPLLARLVLSPALVRELRDAWLERDLRRRAIAAGPVLTLARPAPPPSLGPVRSAIDGDWARELDLQLRRAALAVIVVDGSEANAYEIERARALLGLSRTAIVVPPQEAEGYATLRQRLSFLPPLGAGDRAVRFDPSERAYPMASLLLRDSELAPRPKAPAWTFALAVLAVLGGLFSAIATPIALADRISESEPLVAGGFVVMALAITLAVLSRRAVQLVAANEVVMVTVAASPWLVSAILAATAAGDPEDIRNALDVDSLGAAYSAPLLLVTSVILSSAALVRRSTGRRAAFAVFGAAALLPFLPLAASLSDSGANTDAFVAMLAVAAIALGLAAWGASGEPMRANAPLPVGAAVAAALAAAAVGVAVEHFAWRDLLRDSQWHGQLEIAAPELTSFAHAWPLFALAGPSVVVLLASRFAGRASRASIASLAAFAPMIAIASLVVGLEGRARARVEDPNLAFGAPIIQLAEGTSLAPAFALPDGTPETPWVSERAHVVLDRQGAIVDGVRVAGPEEVRGSSPRLARALGSIDAAGMVDLRVAAARDVPLADLAGLARTARMVGWQRMLLVARNPGAGVGGITVSFANAPRYAGSFEIVLRVRPSDVLLTDQSGTYLSIPRVGGAIDEASVRQRFLERLQMEPNGGLVIVQMDDPAGGTAELVHTAALARAYFPDVRLGGM